MSSLDDILGKKPTPQQARQPVQVAVPVVQQPPRQAVPAVNQKVQTAVKSADMARQRAANVNQLRNGAVPTVQTDSITGVQKAVPQVSDGAAPGIEKRVEEQGKKIKNPPPPPAPERLSYTEMFSRLNPYQPPTKEQLEEERKKERREKTFASISDAISALSDLYFTSQYAPNMYNPEKSQSKQVQGKWDKLRTDREAQMNAYIRGLMNARQADDAYNDRDRNWWRQLLIDMYNRQKDADAFQYKKDRDQVKDDQWQQNFDQKEYQFNTTTGLKKDFLEEEERSHRANEGLKGAKIAEDGRHNRVSEAQGTARITQAERHFRATHNPDGTTKSSGKENNFHLTIGGKTYTYKNKGDYEKAVVREARKRGINMTWGTGKDPYSGLVTGTPKLRTIAGLAGELENRFGAAPKPSAGRPAKPASRPSAKKHSNLNSLMNNW